MTPVLRVVNSGYPVALLDPISGSKLRVVASPAEPEEEDVMLSVTVTLTNAQIKALPTTPVQILAAPGASKIIFPMAAWLRANWAADYTNIDAGAIVKLLINTEILTTLNNTVISGVTQLLAGGGPDGSNVFLIGRQHINATNMFGTSGIYDSDAANKPLTIEVTNGALGAFTGGHASNTLKITVYYVVVDF